MRLYKVLNGLAPSSYAAKFSVLAFFTGSVPILMVALFVLFAEGASALASPVFGVVALSCLVAALLNALGASALVSPLGSLRSSMRSTHRKRVYRPMPSRFADDLGEVMQLSNRLAEDLGARLPNDSVSDSVDPLTGALFRGAFEKAFGEKEGGSLLSLEIADFAEVRRALGQDGADRMMASVGRVLEKATRQGDLVGLLDAGAFCIFLNGAGREVARHVSERIRAGMRDTIEEHRPGTRLTAGLAVRNKDEAAEDLWTRAQDAVSGAGEVAFDKVIVVRLRD